jgi:5-methylcytosine-specific restriction endonuclease McrA
LKQALIGWLLPVFTESGNRQRLLQSVQHWVAELAALAKAYQRLPQETEDVAGRKAASKGLDARRKRIYRNLLTRVQREASQPVAEKFNADWREYYRKVIGDILTGTQGGRVRYCRQHSDEYVAHLLTGKQIPNRDDLTEADLISRKQQILFRRIWRLVESRLLPLAGGVIDRIVVERVAFDILAGPFKARQKLPEEKAAEMYWHGPQLGFTSRLEMLATEFAGRCAYCGQQNAVEQVEHLLPRSAFPFDSYFNILPSCSVCNARKGARTALEAGLAIHDDAYNAYSEYIRTRNVPHVYHTIKKGLLNLLRRSGAAVQAERLLGMLADNLVSIANTQRAPRPLARYLATHLERHTGQRPTVAFSAGRHTALYRSVLLPEYDKAAQKEAEDLRNHAIDAILLGCRLPSAPAMENQRWYATAGDVVAWMEKVKAAGPELLLGIPRVESPAFVPYFEEDLGAGYCKIDLHAFNWNRQRKATHGLDPFGQTTAGRPLKRIAASDVLTALLDTNKREEQIAKIAHRGLRMLLARESTNAPRQFVQWLQRTTEAGLKQGTMSNHPADQARRHLLEAFLRSPVESILDGEAGIPQTIGVRCLNEGSRGKLGAVRADRAGKAFQAYQADPVVREMYVGYRERNGKVDRNKPVLLVVNQVYAVSFRGGGKKTTEAVPADSPLAGRLLGARGSLKAFLQSWSAAFRQLCQQEGMVKVFRITHGCVIEKIDGSRFQLRSFDESAKWMKGSPFRGIRRVLRSPFRQSPQPTL